MEAKSTDRKTIQLLEDGHQLGELIYKNIFFLKADIRLANSERYEVSPVGIFGTSITVTRDGTEIVKLKMNWHGQIVLSFTGGEEIVLKAKGIFSSKYILENKDGELLMQFDSKFNWGNFQYNYEITYDKKPRDILFVLLGVYASNYYIAYMSGANAGMT